MRKYITLCYVLCNILINSAQTNDWYLLNKASEITTIEQGDTNPNELHLATNIGYIKYNTSTDLVTDFLNLTSQDPAIGIVKDIAQDPTSNNIAMTLKDGIAIYDGTNLSVFRYGDSDLTIGENTSQFRYLEAEYAKDGSLYIFKEDAFGYQVFDNNTFQTETTTSFRVKDVVENSSGTKAYFATTNNGLWELEKGTDTWTQYTASNSDLITNTLTSLLMSATDLLYIGGYQGINTLSDSGNWNTYQNNDPADQFPINVFDMSLNESSGELLLQTSLANSYYYGVTIANLSTDTWTTFRNDGLNCLNENVFDAAAWGGDGNAYVSPRTFPQTGELVQLNPTNYNCLNEDVNYLRSPDKCDSSVIRDVDIINPIDTIYIGMTRADRLIDIALPRNDRFNGAFGSISEITPAAGKSALSVVAANDKFIVENDDGWVIVDRDKNTTSHNHSIADYFAIATKKASLNSSNGDVTLIHTGFDAASNYIVYKTPCNTNTGVFGASEEIFTDNRDKSKRVMFEGAENPNTGMISVVGVKTSASGEIHREMLNMPKQTAGNVSSSFDEAYTAYPFFDPKLLIEELSEPISIFIKNETTVDSKQGDDTGTQTFDTNDDTEPDNIYNTARSEMTVTQENYVADYLMLWIGGVESTTGNYQLSGMSKQEENSNTDKRAFNSNILKISDTPITTLNNNLPQDFSISKTVLKQYNETEAIIVLLTNYGLMLKKGVDVSSITLSTESKTLKETSIKLVPNPASKTVSFSNEKIIEIHIYNALGKLVRSSKSNSCNIETLSNGVYFAKGTTSNGQFISEKLVKN